MVVVIRVTSPNVECQPRGSCQFGHFLLSAGNVCQSLNQGSVKKEGFFPPHEICE